MLLCWTFLTMIVFWQCSSKNERNGIAKTTSFKESHCFSCIPLFTVLVRSSLCNVLQALSIGQPSEATWLVTELFLTHRANDQEATFDVRCAKCEQAKKPGLNLGNIFWPNRQRDQPGWGSNTPPLDSIYAQIWRGLSEVDECLPNWARAPIFLQSGQLASDL